VAGTEIAALHIARDLPASQFSHVAVCVDPTSAAGRRFSAAGVPVTGYNPSDLSFRRPGPFIRSSLTLARSFRSLRVDLVHCADVLAACHAVFGARLARLPVVCHVRNPYPRLPTRYRFLLRGVSRFVFVSQHARAEFALRVADDRCAIVYDAVELVEPLDPAIRANVFEEFQLPAKAMLVGMVARLAPQKDHATLLRAARRIVQHLPNTHFLIVGAHSTDADLSRHFQEIRALIDELGLAPHVTLTGFRSDVPRLLSAMDVVVLATHYEGFGLALLEAMAYGRPVVGTAVGGVMEFVLDDQTGLLHRSGDDAHLASQIGSLLTDSARASRLGLAARRLVRERFTPETFARELGNVYRAILEPSA